LSDYKGETAELAISLDVVYHLVEDNIFGEYMERLFDAATKFVIVYADNKDYPYVKGTHVRHRCFTKWIEIHKPNWQLIQNIQNKYPWLYPWEGDGQNCSWSDFYIFQNNEISTNN
jgi:hypothetical protein